MPLNSSLCSRRLEVVGARKNGSDEWLSPFFFFLARSVFVRGTHKEMKPKAALLKLWEKGALIAYLFAVLPS